MIRAAVRMGAISAGADARELDAITSYGTDMGLAFQIADDILNETATPGQIGKPAGSDKAHGKLTWVSTHGLAASRQEAARRMDSALSALKPLRGNTGPLAALARYIVERNT